ncbi:FAD-dependent oxidoreductase [Pseudooceanicola sp. 216_PA32_1]|uniref:FAD-dependent oxidoreductase n=1 Tax=Pseudooceanicola pacificus TaxID=2676438 RepID=A0A844W5I3_9RHOB|nr:glycerol-3-phosphate dehydrogenase/oxidase [Pseudooceanicola pacificus]MWB79117.1 FAD-dependent oxidoreductase [Pseudooceanicola pacificus]
MEKRSEILGRLSSGAFDGTVLIVGGGINGVGVYRDLAAQGVPALLVDKGDFASGTSSAPSRLIHGGLRYLETGEFQLVRESVEERNRLLLNAPHLVKPIPVWVPALSRFGGALSAGLRFLRLKRTPGAKGSIVVRMGLALFDRFGDKDRSMPRHRAVPISEARGRVGFASGVRAVLEYWDARIVSPERYTLELVEDAENDCPASGALPYMALSGLVDGRVLLTDCLDGERFTMRPALVVNCAGPWIDPVDAKIGISEPLSDGTKGSHLILERPDLVRELDGAMLYFETHDHRACLVYALDQRMILLGTTDLRTKQVDEARCSDEEIEYLFGVLRDVLPQSRPARDQIRFTFAGVRPLPRSDAGATGAISRDHTFRDFPADEARPFEVVTLVGGKWTTYRACAEQLVDRILPRLNKTRLRSTLTVPVGGGRDFPSESAGQQALVATVARDGGIATAAAERLVARYGTRARTIAQSLDEAGRKALSGASEYLVGEILYMLRHERVARLQDIVLRRSLLAFEGKASETTVRAVADIVAPELGWTPEQRNAEVEKLLEQLAERHHVSNMRYEKRATTDDEATVA